MDDWAPGDLAWCVRLSLPSRPIPSKILRLGAVYTVTSVRWSVSEQCVAIGLAEVESRGPLKDWHAAAFRKIRPHTPDAEDLRTIALLNGKPVLEPANNTPRDLTKAFRAANPSAASFPGADPLSAGDSVFDAPHAGGGSCA